MFIIGNIIFSILWYNEDPWISMKPYTAFPEGKSDWRINREWRKISEDIEQQETKGDNSKMSKVTLSASRGSGRIISIILARTNAVKLSVPEEWFEISIVETKFSCNFRVIGLRHLLPKVSSDRRRNVLTHATGSHRD